MNDLPPDPEWYVLIPDAVRPFFAALTAPQQQAAALLLLLNAAADPSFKSRYARRWWGIVEERAKLCAMISSDLVRWSSLMAARLQGDVGRNAEHRAYWQTLIAQADPAAVLDALHRDTPVLLGVVRAVSDTRRADYLAAREPASEPEPELTLTEQEQY